MYSGSPGRPQYQYNGKRGFNDRNPYRQGQSVERFKSTEKSVSFEDNARRPDQSDRLDDKDQDRDENRFARRTDRNSRYNDKNQRSGDKPRRQYDQSGIEKRRSTYLQPDEYRRIFRDKTDAPVKVFLTERDDGGCDIDVADPAYVDDIHCDTSASSDHDDADLIEMEKDQGDR
ncbi:hypothetical protein E4U41_002102 [Claviceps citrina]|nr:hypothetical protein E4U41_002102 [Claviceps citrina]